LDDAAWAQACDALLKALQQTAGEVLIVSEQTGWGVVPATAIGGLFRDRLGALEQRLVAHAQACWLVVCGRAIDLFACSLSVPGGC
jgi:adenosylcobinamide kinase/adenosylcobinamide-phosphate guanylyltransferase